MAAPTPAFGFDENAEIETNLNAFSAHLARSDSLLSSVLVGTFPKLRDESYVPGDVWTGLYDALLSSDDVSSSVIVVPPVAASTTPLPASVAGGWFLEGVSIEGFRGINNEGKPLELKFKPDKVNSVSAVNGVGKTSIYDAIRFAISGRLPWLDDLPATDRDGDYYLNRFHGAKTATIKLALVEAVTGQQCEIIVIRDQLGNRTVTATAPWDGSAVLKTLDREFVLLDGPTFQNFIAAKPQARGRTFAGLLGLSEYSYIRQALAALAHTKAFNNYFNAATIAQNQAHAEKGIRDAGDSIHRDYAILAGQDWTQMSLPETLAVCHKALEQIGPLKELCEGREFREIDIDACIEAVKAAEGGPKRERLTQCIRDRQDLLTLTVQAPDTIRSGKLAELAVAREEAVAKTAGDVMLHLFQAGAKALQLPEWANRGVCPLCDSDVPHDLQNHVNGKLADFTALDSATQAVALEWNEAGWTNLTGLEKLLETEASARKIALSADRAMKGVITGEEARGLSEWLSDLRARADKRDEALRKEQAELEKELPQSSVEVTKKVEAARRIQEACIKLDEAVTNRDAAKKRADQVVRIKSFLDRASSDFAVAETAISKARLAAIEPIFKANFGEMSFLGVTPAVSKRANSEDLQIRLAEFYGLSDLSPQALLSESCRNAFAIALYLAAASLYGGMPKFIVLDDVTSSFDAGHQLFLIELLRKTFARPGNPNGLQVIILSHDTMLEKLFNKHATSGIWWHQRLEGMPQFAVLPQTGAVNKVRDHTISMLQAGQVDFAKEGVRQYLEYRLSELISRLRIPVPVDVAFNDNKQLAGEFLNAIDAAVKLHNAANSLVLSTTQQAGLNSNMTTIVGNFLSHWGTGQTLSFTAPALLGVMNAIDQYCDCFKFEPAPGASKIFYKSLSQRQ
ncbi:MULTISPECIES: AAA family ATPase [unclassified Sinorhizobium]|uniref:ATP-binding protein n=1 Tax=unclassified Sinorhizobium TaxID=2613772 RepID=UPI0035242CC2